MSTFIIVPRQIEAKQIECGDYLVHDPALGDFLVSAAKFAALFRRPYHDARAEQNVENILRGIDGITESVRTELRNSFSSLNPLEFAKHLRSVGLPELVARKLLTEKIGTR